MTTSLPFLQVDVFTDRPFFGNPVAVVLDADGLDAEAMQRIARWTNLSETTFVLRPTDPRADYRLRIFTPGGELPFAGHPTLGSARAVLASARATARDGRLVQQCEAGLVPLRIDADGQRLSFEVPPARVAPVAPEEAEALRRALGPGASGARFDAIDLGPLWLTASLADAATVLALDPDQSAIAAISRRLHATGVTVYGAFPPGHRDRHDAALDTAVRSFAPAIGVAEDPVCGSGNACVALQRRAAGQTHAYVAAQGEAMGREGRIVVGYRGDAIDIGGAAVVCVEGRLRIA
jgi:PhzF family phenazine biosynthesis protein